MRFLTEAQEARIPEFQQKWQQIYRSTARIDRERAAAALRQVYRVMGKPEPEIIFCPSPRAALERLRPYIASVEPNFTPPPTGDPNPFNVVSSIVGSIWEIVQIDRKQQQSASKLVTNLVEQISKTPADLLAQQIERSLPKDLSPQDIYKQAFGGAAPMFDFMEQSTNYGQELESTKPPKPDRPIDWQEAFTMLEDPALAPQLAFLSLGGAFWRVWLKGILQSTAIARITGIKHPDLLSATFASINVDRNTGRYAIENPPVFTSQLALNCTWLDFANTVLNYPLPNEKWRALQELVAECGCIFAVGNFAIICDRPTKMLVDDRNFLHAEGETALEYTDGFCTYAYRGRIIAEKYGIINADRWQAEWVLSEQNPATRRILLREIGAVRLCRELPVTELDRVAEYQLLKLDNIDLRDAHILKRIDPLTGTIDAVFVENRSTVRSAIDYANKSISSDRFPLTNSTD